jgi:hypothetical protein
MAQTERDGARRGANHRPEIAEPEFATYIRPPAIELETTDHTCHSRSGQPAEGQRGGDHGYGSECYQTNAQTMPCLYLAGEPCAPFARTLIVVEGDMLISTFPIAWAGWDALRFARAVSERYVDVQERIGGSDDPRLYPSAWLPGRVAPVDQAGAQ